MGDIGLGLVVVVVGDKILHRVVGKELFELLAQLGGQRFVVGQNQRGTLDGLNNLCHCVGLAGAGDAQQHLLPQAVAQTLRQFRNGLGLVACGLIFGNNLEIRHSRRLLSSQ